MTDLRVRKRGVSALEFAFDLYTKGGMEERAMYLICFMVAEGDDVK